jgi:capsular polysaccharide transport system ATP-binding protein
VIRLNNVTKVYTTEGHRRIVLDRVSFTLKSDVSYGILGVNGAGKSTMMRLIAGTEDPTRGKVTRSGKVSWPLGFAGGFHAAMTGKENVVFVSRIYGEDPLRVLEFVDDFAEIGDYINVPVKTYSSGMQARLAFGLSMALQFDTYLVDEVTAVGDARFQARCHEHFTRRREHANIIMVSHGMETLREYCTQGIVLANGRAMMYEDITEAIEVYRRINQ